MVFFGYLWVYSKFPNFQKGLLLVAQNFSSILPSPISHGFRNTNGRVDFELPCIREETK